MSDSTTSEEPCEDISSNNVNPGDVYAALNVPITKSTGVALVLRTSNSEDVQASDKDKIPTKITNIHMALKIANRQVVFKFSNAKGWKFGLNFTSNCEKLEPSLSSFKALPSSHPTIIEAMIKSPEKLDHEMMVVISTHLGKGWKNVVRELNYYTDGQIEQSLIDNQIQGGVQEVIYQLLKGWTDNAKEGEATLGVITQILLKFDHRECVHNMKDIWKLCQY